MVLSVRAEVKTGWPGNLVYKDQRKEGPWQLTLAGNFGGNVYTTSLSTTVNTF